MTEPARFATFRQNPHTQKMRSPVTEIVQERTEKQYRTKIDENTEEKMRSNVKASFRSERRRAREKVSVTYFRYIACFSELVGEPIAIFCSQEIVASARNTKLQNAE